MRIRVYLMKKMWLSGIACLFLVIGTGPLLADYADSPSILKPGPEHIKSTKIITQVISRYHYKKQEFNDQLSQQVFDRYIEALDPNRAIFLKADIDRFSRYQRVLDDYLLKGNIEPAFEIFTLYQQRVNEAVNYANSLLEKGFDFTIDEKYRIDRDDASWPASNREREAVWRKRVKNDWLGLRMAKKEPEKIVETLRKRYQGLARRISQFKTDDVYQAFINSYTLSLEPHTSYMSPSNSENFDISMRLSLEGIGAVLRMDGELTTVQRTVPGGPAKLSGQIHSGDSILGVGQGLDGEIEDVIGWPLQDVVEKIRGPKGTVVRLQVKPKGGDASQHKLVTLVRNKIKLEEQAASKSITEGLDGMGKVRIGVIELPTFYRDFAAQSRGEKNFRSTTRDVRRLLEELKHEGVDGVVIDLRGNGGGSLNEATELTGLFIDTGPVVQIKDAVGRVELERDSNPGVTYDGPLAVLVDRNSASASEIFAGAIQDYRRGIVIGEPTFGKGTVQTLVDLRRFVSDKDADLGRLRLTMAQFFRVNGGSTQHKGVIPDIVFPTANYISEHGERALENALPWAEIKPASFRKSRGNNIAYLRQRHLERIAGDPGFELLEAQERMIDAFEKRKEVSLLEERRKAEWDDQEKKRLEYKNRFLTSVGIGTADNKGDAPAHGAGEDDDAESEAIRRIQLNETVMILTESILADGPKAAMQLSY